MVGALWTGISGLAGQQTALDNESNNIANVNTVGYKSSRISFADQMYQNKIGKGSQVLDAEKLFTQGNLKVTGVNYDVALSGDGFFTVSNTRGSGTAETFYTRAGNFRMGDSGTLQDTIGNEVQGWSMAAPETISSNPNVDYFTGDYTKLLSSKIIQYSSAIETVTAKATDYTLTAQNDDETVFSGAGLKTKYGKIADVEELVKAYTSALQDLKNDPNVSSSTAIAQISSINLPDQGSSGSISQDGDEVYVYIDGNKISQAYITGTANGTLTAEEDGYIKTMKAFADKISTTPGLKAYVADDSASITPSTDDTDVKKGILKIESIVPGQSFTISSTGMVNNGTDKPGTFEVELAAESGSGVGALESIRNALNEAVTGKQTDVYTLDDLTNPEDAQNTFDYSYQISINGQNVPTTPLSIVDPNDIDDFVSAINNDGELSQVIKAENINGNLVIRTTNSNFDVEFSGDMKGPESEVQTMTLTGTVTADGSVTFLGTTLTGFTAGDTVATVVNKVIDNAETIIATWNAANPNTEIKSIEKDASNNLIITYKATEGDVAIIAAAAASNGITQGASVESTIGETTTADLKRNAEYSGREGAGAEFLEITTRIDQSASKGSLQLRLDTLNISDSAFGDFSVDDTGLITMSQDGAQFAVGQIAIAKFITNRGLEPIGNNLLKSTLASGDPIYNTNNDKTAEVKSNTLELSTADLSESLVNLMVFQRAFEANAKSITTADTILNTLIQLKR